ncbi:hypothetical protein AKJ35_01030 [candidate division MSBL1 archaeon SCGC-AAA833F18]|uniref:Type II methyltransferase n=1 Tax=candidate division MSBL1 archaeon SCGC-AAA833F18 TaxID=1698257 RepID=A0A133VSB9_9EURY|nr:hypothetical protein AKJ35_01030 [candidate division MSBL1 archaeon SCGC-AAA833F18]
MKEITHQDYEEYVKKHDVIEINDGIGKEPIKIKIGGKKKIKRYQPKDFELETVNVWSFPQRGNWATHKGDYRGNWPPQMARNIILRYSEVDETVLDQMVGSGTTLVECKLLGRNGIGVDINEKSLMLTRDRLNFDYDNSTEQRTYLGDARNLNLIEDDSIDLIATHPPYANIIAYSKENGDDLSSVESIDDYVSEMRKVAEESYRVLKPGKYCAILVGDTRRKKHHIPIAFRVMQAFLEPGFILKEDVVKHQWQCKTTGFWSERSKKYNFLLLMHEHLFVLRKPGENEDSEKFKESMRWW